MTPFKSLTATAAPILRPNIDTDVIIPSREMKTVSKAGLSDGAFANWRYRDVEARIPNPDFVLNQDRYQGAEILVVGPNFGCGSSREHAVWALKELGIRVVLAPSFGAIFEKNCVMNALVPARVGQAEIERLASHLDAGEAKLTVDLEDMSVLVNGQFFAVHLNEGYRAMLLNGWDAIALTLQQADEISAWQAKATHQWPWVKASLTK